MNVLLDRYNSVQVPFLTGMDHVHQEALANLTDEELLSRALTNPSVFEFLVARYQRHFLERATYVVKDRDEAEDIVQDTFVRIYRFAPRFNGNAGTFRAWAMTILMNVARTKYQKKSKEWKRQASLTPEHYESLAEPSSTEALEAKDIVRRALEFVPHDVKTILQLAFIQGLPYREIARLEGTTEGAIKTRVHRAKKVLRSIIGNVDSI